jgi:regulator of replication initiation timing
MRRAIIILLIFLPAFAFAETVHQTQQIKLSAEGVNRFEIICGAGSFDLHSVAGLESIRVTAQIEVEDLKRDALQTFIEENVRLNLEKREHKAILQSKVVMSSINRKEARINLSITVPSKLDVKIIDASGPVCVKDFEGNLEIDDDSGKIEIETIIGNLRVNDGSGSIVIEDIKGKVVVKDGSGFIEIYHVEGDVTVSDGSGYIKIRNIDGNITMSDDSGDIDIKKVFGNVFIREAGTGELDVDLITGKVTIRE